MRLPPRLNPTLFLQSAHSPKGEGWLAKQTPLVCRPFSLCHCQAFLETLIHPGFLPGQYPTPRFLTWATPVTPRCYCWPVPPPSCSALPAHCNLLLSFKVLAVSKPSQHKGHPRSASGLTWLLLMAIIEKTLAPKKPCLPTLPFPPLPPFSGLLTLVTSKHTFLLNETPRVYRQAESRSRKLCLLHYFFTRKNNLHLLSQLLDPQLVQGAKLPIHRHIQLYCYSFSLIFLMIQKSLSDTHL